MPSQAPFHQASNSNMPDKNTCVQTHQHPKLLMDNIADATKEITSNPSFQSALAAAISSIVGKSGGSIGSPLEVGYATNYLNRTSTAVPSIFPQARNLKFDIPPFVSSKEPFVAGSSEKGDLRK